MIIIGENLKGLIESEQICSSELFDTYSITLRLDSIIYEPQTQNSNTIKYGLHSTQDFYKEKKLDEGELTLGPNQCVLACSSQHIKMPRGYMGFVQTKGTLARMFVSSHCTDSQIEPGFEGKVTLELMNHSPFNVVIPVESPIAQLYIARCSTESCPPYSGKYREYDKPTIPLPFNMTN